ncbi:DUF6665 family protein [Siculibacillus lacustris]|nr:DUF6665 family protein [Siculibacillus lacustris]
MAGRSIGRGAEVNGILGIDLEILGEQASALGRAGRRVEATLAALAAGDASDHDRLIRAAAEAVWAYFIQREVCGLRRHDEAIAVYGIPREVLVRVGGG